MTLTEPFLPWIAWAVRLLAAVVVLATLVPLLPTDERWVRIWDFPRVQVAAVAAVALVAAAVVFRRAPVEASAWACVLGLVVVYQLWRIHPFTPAHAVEARPAVACDEADRFRLLIGNVLMDNRAAAPTLDLVRTLDPDVVLLVETDSWWHQALQPLAPAYPYSVMHPQENTYGMHLFSRFPLVDPQVRFLLEPDIPSIATGMRLRSGTRIRFYGVHPQPPPLDDTAERDAELLLVGREVRKASEPAIVAGDLNDVAWSSTNRLFKRVSGLLDPRVGRGLYATFNARWPLLRWPLDHVFFSPEFTLVDMRKMGDIGSDHFPLYIELCYQPAVAEQQAPPPPDVEDVEDARESIRKGRQEAQEPGE